jgi:hypothetical protein
MSQYQSPYNPPPFPQTYGYAPPNQSNAGRRASTLMMVLGGLILLLGLLNTFAYVAMPAEQMLARQKAMMPSNADFPITATTYKAMAVIVGIITITTGAVLVALAVGVRRGSKAGTITAIVVTSLLLLFMGLMLLTFLLAGLGSPTILAFSCLPGSAFALGIWQLIWLIGAARNTGQLSAAEQQYRTQYWQYQQNMQAYQGYGYGAASPSPSAPPPPPQANDSDRVEE